MNEYGDGRVFQRGTMFHIAWHEDGVERRESAHTTDELEAYATLREKITAHRAGRKVQSNADLTVEALCARVILKFQTKKQNLKDALGNAKIWTGALGATTSLHAVPDRILGLIREWQEAEEDERGYPLDDGYSDASINRRLAFLQTGARLLKFAPLHDVAKDHKLREDNVRDAYIAPVEFARLYAAAATREQDVADYLEWLYLTGMRRGEASLLEARWVDTHRWVLTIPGRIQKHRKTRAVYLDGPLRRLVTARLARAQPQVPYLFHRDGVPVREIKRLWATLCTEAGLVDVRPHDLRRSAVTNLLDYLSPKQAMQITGHLTLSTFTRYQQVPEEQLRARLRSIPEPAWSPTPSASSRAA